MQDFFGEVGEMEEQERKIESLRMRLQSERLISKIARKKADQLAQRVVELETQLEIVLNQKTKAEKAAATVLSILRGNEIEYSDEDASGTGQEEIWNSPCEGILSYSETTPEQTSGEENYVELSPKDADLCSPVEASEFDSGTNANGCEADEEMDRESEKEACYQSKEEVREKEEMVKGADPSGSGELRPQADTTGTKAASSSRLAVEKSLSNTLVEANNSKENDQDIPKDRLDSGSTTSSRSVDHSRAERGSSPVHVQETLGAAEAKEKQSAFLVRAASFAGTPNSSKFQTISRESSDSRLLQRTAASQGSTSSISVGEVERILESLQLAKFSIQSGVDKSSSCEGEMAPKQDSFKKTEASVELPFISCTGLFRVPPTIHGAGTGNNSLLPYSDLVTDAAHGDQHDHL